MKVKGGTKIRKNIERKSIAACLALMLMVALLGGAGSVEMVSAEEANAVNIARYAVVRILGIGPDGSKWTGTGFGVAGDGKYADTFVTNWHVVTSSGEYDYDDCTIYILLDDETYHEYDSDGNYVGFHLGSVVECEVLYAENEYPDVAIIQTPEPVSGVEILSLRKATQDIVGQTVYAIGYPASADTYDYSEGSIKDRDWASVESVTVTTGVVSRCTTFTYADNKYHIFTDAHINGGNSGGPLVLSDGSVVGINTYGYGGTDADEYSVSVYIDYAIEALDDLGIEYNLADDTAEESSDSEAGSSDSQAGEASDSEAGSGDSQESEAGDSESSASSGDSESSSISGEGDGNSSGDSDDGDSFIYFVIAVCVIVAAVVIVVIVINTRKKKSAGGSSSGSAGASAASGAGGNSPAGAAGSSSDAAGGSSGAAGSAAGDNGFRLQGTAGAFAGRRFRIEGETFIGRDPARCKIVYPNKTAGVSSVHCSVRVQNGTAMIMDMGSTYGTFVNGRRLDPNRAYSLSIGDKISLGTPQESFQVTRQGGVV